MYVHMLKVKVLVRRTLLNDPDWELERLLYEARCCPGKLGDLTNEVGPAPMNDWPIGGVPGLCRK